MTSLPLQPVPEADAQRLSYFQPEPQVWLWPGRIPVGALTLITGDPGLGKSMLALDIAARLTINQPWPDGAQPVGWPADVLYLGGEDALSSTVLARFAAAGGDPRRMVIVRGMRDPLTEATGPLHLGKNHQSLRNVLQNRCSSPALVLIDPLWAYLPATASATEVRAAVDHVNRIAHDLGVAFIAVTHLTKRLSPQAMYRSAGSLALIAATRCAYLIAADPDDFSPEQRRRIWVALKNNLAKPVAGMAFSVQDNRIEWHADQPVRACGDEAMLEMRASRQRAAMERADATEMLEYLLIHGPVASSEVFAAAGAYGLGRAVVREVAKEMGVSFHKVGKCGPWFWHPHIAKIDPSSPTLPKVVENSPPCAQAAESPKDQKFSFSSENAVEVATPPVAPALSPAAQRNKIIGNILAALIARGGE